MPDPEAPEAPEAEEAEEAEEEALERERQVPVDLVDLEAPEVQAAASYILKRQRFPTAGRYEQMVPRVLRAATVQMVPALLPVRLTRRAAAEAAQAALAAAEAPAVQSTLKPLP